MGALLVVGIFYLLVVFLPRWAEHLSLGSSPADERPAPDIRVFTDPELGKVSHDLDRNTLEIEVVHQGRPIPFQLYGTKDIPAGLDLLRALRRDLEGLERRARAVCVRDMLAEANEERRFDSAPALDGAGFEACLTLLWLVAEIEGSYRLGYSFDDQGVVAEATLAEGPVSAYWQS